MMYLQYQTKQRKYNTQQRLRGNIRETHLILHVNIITSIRMSENIR